jgi:predicted TPR repeat methyltransferase
LKSIGTTQYKRRGTDTESSEPSKLYGGQMRQTPKLWQATYEATNPEDLADAYRKWAELYDQDTREVMGYVGPETAATILDCYMDSKDGRVLDAGCGTGLVGEVLRRLGYANVDAMDYSSDMLSVAEKKAVYTKVFQDDMNRKLDIADDTYDASICVGTFTYAHVGPEAFTELVRVTRPGGYICLPSATARIRITIIAKRCWKWKPVRNGSFRKCGMKTTS